MDNLEPLNYSIIYAVLKKKISDMGEVLSWLGVTTTEITDGSTTNPIVIDGVYVTATNGNVVAYNGVEYVFNGTAWQAFGRDTVEETISGANPVIIGEANHIYKCETVSTLSFTPSSSGICEVIFGSGATAAVLTLPNTVLMPEWWTGCEANQIYDISIVDGVYGAVMAWPST